MPRIPEGGGSPASEPNYWQLQVFYEIHGHPAESAQEQSQAMQYPGERAAAVAYIDSHKATAHRHDSIDHSGLPASSGGDLMSLIHEAGFRGQAASTMYGIVMAESGGNATAHNTNASTGDNSYGLAQINMLGSMGPARLREYGLRSNADLFDPLTNLKVAYKMSGGGTHFGDWSTYNSGAYQQYMNQTGATVSYNGSSGGGGGGGVVTGNAPVHASDFSSVDGLGNLLQQVPALKHLVDKAVAQNWTPDEFQNQVEDSHWYKNHSATARAVLIQQANDPSSYQQSLNDSLGSLTTLSHQLGMNLNSKVLDAIATHALLTGNENNQQWLTQQIGAHQDYSHVTSLSGLQGGMAATAQQLQSLAADYGYNWSPKQTAENAQQILMGNQTIDTYKQRLTSWAKSAFPSLAKELDGGTTVKQLADPYVQSMSNLLEVDPSTLNTYTPMIRQALQGTRAKADAEPVTIPLWQFEKQVRQDPRWGYTQNAKDTMSHSLLQIGRTFGFGPEG